MSLEEDGLPDPWVGETDRSEAVYRLESEGFWSPKCGLSSAPSIEHRSVIHRIKSSPII